MEKGMATHSSILAWRIPRTEEPGGLQSRGHKEWDTTEQLTHTHTHTRARAHTHSSVGLSRGLFVSTSSLSLPQKVEPGEMLHLTDTEPRAGQVKGTLIPTPREAGMEYLFVVK